MLQKVSKKLIKNSVFLFALLLSTSVFAQIEKAPFQGQTYRIAEPNLWNEIQRREKKALPWVEQRVKQLQKKIYNPPKWAKYLPPAKRSYSYSVKLEYTLKHNIPEVDAQGQIVGILYPKGYTFNILHHLVVMPPTLIIFNAKRPKEVALALQYAKKYPYSMLITVDGSAVRMRDQYQLPVYYLPEWMIKRLHLRNTLSLVFWNKQKGEADIVVKAVREGKNEK